MKIKIPFTFIIFIALLGGIVFGLLAPGAALKIKILGDIFLKLITLLIFPLILIVLPAGIAQLGDIRRLGRIGLWGVIYSYATNIISTSIGIALGLIFFYRKGIAIHLPAMEQVQTAAPPSLREVILNLIPGNLVADISANNVMAVLLFAILFSIALLLSKEKGKAVAELLNSLSAVIFSLVDIIMKIAPVGVFALSAYIFAQHGSKLILPMAGFLAAVWLGIIGFLIFYSALLLKLWGKIPILNFYKGVSEAAIVGISTCSQGAALPINIKNTVEKLSVPKDAATFMISFNIAKGGTALYQGLATIFIASIFAVELSPLQLFLLVLLISIIYIPGVPASGTLLLAIVFSSFGIPMAGISILMGIDRIRDMICTAGNVTISALGAVVVSKLSK